MCRMPIDHSDPTFGNIYFQDGSTRPHEIVWSCGYNEYCCGYECCPYSGGGWGWGRGGSSSYWSVGIGISFKERLHVYILSTTVLYEVEVLGANHITLR
uniref:CX domain-containing protein n=1 Tax=Parascaris equorum TaxID=6256 RepID=A0A914RJ60_PAREQ